MPEKLAMPDTSPSLQACTFDLAQYVDHAFVKKDFAATQNVAITFENCTFQGCTLTKALFRGCDFIDCTFVDCDLSLVKIPKCNLQDLRFEHTKLIGINWTASESQLYSRLQFHHAVLNYASFGHMQLKEAIFKDSQCKEVDFSHANLEGASFEGSDLTGASFSQSNLVGANFQHAKNYTISPYKNKIKNAKFSLPEALNLLEELGIDIVW